MTCKLPLLLSTSCINQDPNPQSSGHVATVEAKRLHTGHEAAHGLVYESLVALTEADVGAELMPVSVRGTVTYAPLEDMWTASAAPPVATLPVLETELDCLAFAWGAGLPDSARAWPWDAGCADPEAVVLFARSKDAQSRYVSVVEGDDDAETCANGPRPAAKRARRDTGGSANNIEVSLGRG